MGEIVSIWIKRAHGGPMDPVEQSQLIAGRGLVGNADQGGRRQITIIDEAAWSDATRELGADVGPSARRANVMLRGIDLENARGMNLVLGECVINILAETTPCPLMEEMKTGLQQALKPHWRGGVSGEIVRGGTIRVGDRVSFE